MTKKVFLLLMLSYFTLFWSITTDAKTFESQSITIPDKSWTISFNEVLSPSADLKSIFIKTADGRKHESSLTISDDLKKIIVKPKNPYLLGTQYELFIPKGFESDKRNKLREDVTMKFSLKGLYIQNINAIANPFATHVLVQGTPAVSKITLSINSGVEEITIRRGSNQFSRGLIGVISGDLLKIRAYNLQGKVIEIQNYVVE